MEFSFTEEQEAFRQTMRKFALEVLLPRYRQGDRNREYPEYQRRRIFDIIGHPPRRDFIMAGIAVEEIARGDFNCAFFGTRAAGENQSPLIADIPERLRQKLGVSDDTQIALALTEPEAGSDLGAVQSKARREGDLYLLKGEKNSVSYLNAEVFIVFARTHPDVPGWRGVSAFLVPRSVPGLSFQPYDDLGCRSIPRGQLILDDTPVPAENMIWGGSAAEGGESFKRMVTFFNTNKAYIGLMCLGATQQTLDETVAYVKMRKAFGFPLARFEGVSFPIVEAATLVEAMRLLCYKTLWLRQTDAPHMLEGAMAKWWIPSTCVQILNQCLVLHGHYGYNEELPIAQRLRDVIGWQIGDGPPQIQKILMSRAIFGREFSPIG